MKNFFVLYGILQFGWLFQFSQSVSAWESPYKTFIEDETLYITNVENGPRKIGDLWDCRTSRSAEGLNLYTENISDYMRATPIPWGGYNWPDDTNLKTILDHTFGMTEEFKLDIMAGILRLDDGNGGYFNGGYDFFEEKLVINYFMESFIIGTTGSGTNAIDQMTKDKILNGQINATHVVHQVTLGGQVLASIPLKSNNRPENRTQIYESIFSIMREISRTSLFPKLNRDGIIVTGVPVKYRLLPISRILYNFKIEKLYQKLSDEMIFRNFMKMLDLLQKYQSNGFIKKQLVDQNPHLIKVLSDPENDYTKLFQENESQLNTRAREFGQRTRKVLLDYKKGAISITSLDDFYNQEFLTNFNPTLIQENVDYVFDIGDKICKQARLNYFKQDSKIKIISSKNELDIWWSEEKSHIKILLLTNGTAPRSAFKLYELGPSLSDQGIELSVALPNTCQNFAIIIIVNGQTFSFKNEKIITVIRVLSTLLDKGERIDRNFVQITSSLNGISSLDNFPLSNFMDIYNSLEIFSYIELVDNSYELKELIFDQKEDGFVYILAMSAYLSIYDSLKLSANFQHQFPAGRWIGSDFSFNNKDAPLLIIFKNGVFVCVIFDNIDLLFVLDHIKMGKLEEIKNTYKFTAKTTLGKNFVYPEKLEFVHRILNNFRIPNIEPKYDYNERHFKEIENLLTILVAATSPNKFEFLEKVLRLVGRYHLDIYFSASKYLTIYNQNGETVISNENIQDWRTFLTNLQLQSSEKFFVQMLVQTIDFYLRTNEKDQNEILQNFLDRIPENEIVDKNVVQNALVLKDYWKAIQLLAPQRFTSANSLKFLLEINKVENFQDQNERLGFYQEIFRLDLNSEEIDEICNDPIISYYSSKDGDKVTKEKFMKQSPMPPAKNNLTKDKFKTQSPMLPAKNNFTTPDLE